MGAGVTGVDASALARAMGQEAELLEQFAGEQERLLETVRARSWTALERDLESLRALEHRIGAADRHRLEALPGGAGDAESFARLVQGLEAPARMELERAYHALGLAVLRVKGALSRLDHYVGAVMGSMNAVLGELLPYRKGRIYSARGDHRHAQASAIVVDRTL